MHAQILFKISFKCKTYRDNAQKVGYTYVKSVPNQYLVHTIKACNFKFYYEKLDGTTKTNYFYIGKIKI